MTAVTTVIFDLSEVYLRGLKGVERFLEPVLGMEKGEIFRRLNCHELGCLFHGRIGEDEYWSDVIEKNGWDIDTVSLKKAVRDNFTEIEGTKEIIERLKNMGYRLGLLSDHAREWVEFCNHKFGYHKLFHSVLYSFEVGVSKPDMKIYTGILEKLNARPEECIFIDDKYENLAPAKKLGIKTILFENAGQLERELASLGVLG